MGWNKRKFVPWMIIISFILSMVCVKFVAAQDDPFVVGLEDNPPKLDPQDQYDSESQKLIGQVCEGLYRYNYSSPEMESIPQLATALGYFEGNSVIGYNYTVTLREDVTFHDGTPFNASAVKWTFDRILYFTVGLWEDGILIAKSIELMESASLFSYQGRSILNTTVIESEFVVRFVLNTAPGFFERLLAFMATQMMLPDADYVYGARFAGFIGLEDKLIGTGPFELVKYDYDHQVVFKAYEDYYLTRPPSYIKTMIYRIIPDDTTRALAFLQYEIHWSAFTPHLDEFKADPNLVEIDVKRLVVNFIQMNMENMPQAVRKASAFAYNYTHLIEERFGGNGLYIHTPIPDGMLYHHTGFTDEPYLNLTYARELILAEANGSAPISSFERNVSDSNLGPANTTEEWKTVADGTNPIAWYNFTGYSGLENHYDQLADNMKDIGIRIDMIPLMPFFTVNNEYLHDEEANKKFTYSFGGWGPDYNDPINMIAPLYGRNAEGDPASGNCFLLNDPTLNEMINETYFTTNATTPTREELFHDIQERIVTELVPSFYIYQRISSISFNILYVEETFVDDMKNAFGDYYWFNVIHYPPMRCCREPWYYISRFIGGLAVTALVITLVIILTKKALNRNIKGNNIQNSFAYQQRF